MTHFPSPCYILEEERLLRNLELLHSVEQAADVKIICALKGYAMWSSFPMVKQYLSGATASSLNEAKLIHDEMYCQAHTYCPVYTDVDFDVLASMSSHLTFNSLNQYERFYQRAKQANPAVRLGLRLNPGYSEVETDLYNPASPNSRLGIYDPLNALPEGIDGVHFHALCENDSYTLERTLHAFEQQYAHLIRQAQWLNLGGGHHITRKDYDVNHLIGLLKGLHERYPNLQEIILEPGEAVGWQTGFLTATVEDLIEKPDLTIAMLNVSFACHMPDCLEMPYKPAVRGATEPQQGKVVYRLGGNSCLAGDFVGDYSFEKPLHIGDQLIFEDMIHYTMVKTTFFNGVHHPDIGVLRLNGEFELLRQFSHEDYKRTLS